MPRRRSATPSAHHDSDMYAIFRKDGAGGTGQRAWLVHLTRGGRGFQMTFSDGTYGGEAAALFVARAWRDAVLEVVPPLTLRDMRMLKRRTRRGQPGDRPRSEITGVHYAEATHNRPGRWIARIELKDDTKPSGRRTISRAFSIAELGDDAAREAAEAARLQMVLAVENGDDPALRSPAAKRLHGRLGRKARTGAKGEMG